MFLNRFLYGLFCIYVEKIVLKNNNFVISFTGGLGNQLISFFAYSFLKNLGKNVSKDVTYFYSKDIQDKYKIRGISVFKWELDKYIGVNLEDKNKKNIIPFKNFFKINDGFVKLYLALKFSKKVNFLNKFKNSLNSILLPNDLQNKKYICVHFRQGDYLKVASLLPNLDDLLNCASNFASICQNIIILSDGNLDPNITIRLKKYGFKDIKLITAGEPITAHLIMVFSSILICSNSQFSLSAGLLNKNIVIIPKRWYAQFKLKIIEILIEEFSSKYIVF